MALKRFEVDGFKQMIAKVVKDYPFKVVTTTLRKSKTAALNVIYGFLTGQDPQWAVECGTAHGALAMTTPGYTSMVTLPEVIRVMQGVGSRIAR